MKHPTLSIHLLLIALLSLTSACAGPDDRPGTEIRAQVDDRDNLQTDVDDYLHDQSLDPFLMQSDGGMTRFEEHLDNKVNAMNGLLSRLENFLTDLDRGDKDHTWATLQLSILHLNLGCELQLLELPTDLTPADQVRYRTSLSEIIIPLVAQSRALVTDLEPTHSGPAANHVYELTRIFNEEDSDVFSICERSIDLWSP